MAENDSKPAPTNSTPVERPKPPENREVQGENNPPKLR